MNSRSNSLVSIAWLFLFVPALGGCAAAVDDDDFGEDSAEPETDIVDESGSELSVTAALDSEEAAFLGLIDVYRGQHGLPALKASAAATCAADFHSRDMADKNYFSHTLASGKSWSDNMTSFGYNYNTYRGENIAAGYPTAAQTFDQWKNSPGHDANMRGTDYKVIGIARANDADSNYKYYWTTDFGGYADEVFGSPWVKNGGFESAITTSTSSYGALRTLSTWRGYASSGTKPARSTAALHGGSYGVKLINPASGRGNLAELRPSTPGRTYRLTAWSRKVSGSSTQSMWVNFLDANYKTIAQITGKSTSSTSWTQLSTTGKSPSGTKYVLVVLGRGATNTGSTYYWDEVTLDTICPGDGSASIP